MRILNIVNAVSNFPVIGVLCASLRRQDFLTFSVAAFVGTFSFFSHLEENHKHFLPGLSGLDSNTSFILNRLDVIGAIMTASRLSYIYYQRYGASFAWFIAHPQFSCLLALALSLNVISEKVFTTKKRRILYTATHSLWHILIFSLINSFLEL